MDSKDILKLAEHLDGAILEAREVERLTLSYPKMTLEEAYLIQDSGIHRRIGRGEKKVGFKMGLTSQAKRQQMNLNSPIYGVLTDQMELQNGSKFSLKGTIHPKIEPEIAFLINREIRGPVTAEQAVESCSGVCAALEILDSRYLNFKYFSLPDVVADNCSSAYFILSNEIKSLNEVKSLDMLEMTMRTNGEIVQRSVSNAISSHPINSLIQLCEMLYARNLTLPAGSIVLAGAATQAVPLEIGSKVSLDVESLGSVSITIDV